MTAFAHSLTVAGFVRKAAITVVKQILEDGQAGATYHLPLCWQWHNKTYMGGAHGTAGESQSLLTAY